MTYYGARELEASFRTVRKNTIAIAEEIPAEQYGFKATPEVRSVGEMLAHIATALRWQQEVHTQGIDYIDFALFGGYMQMAALAAQELRTKEQIVAALKESGEEFAAFLGALSEDQLAQIVSFPPPIEPATKSRLQLLVSAREHELHHRAQLMLVQRLLGIVPHLTRQREAMMAQARP